MPKLLRADEIAAYRGRGYHFPIEALSASEVAGFRRRLDVEPQEVVLGERKSADRRL